MAVATTDRSNQPVVASAPGGSLVPAPGVVLLESEQDGGGLLAGYTAWSWAAGDACGRRLAAVVIVEADSGPQVQVGAGLGGCWDDIVALVEGLRGGGGGGAGQRGDASQAAAKAALRLEAWSGG